MGRLPKHTPKKLKSGITTEELTSLLEENKVSISKNEHDNKCVYNCQYCDKSFHQRCNAVAHIKSFTHIINSGITPKLVPSTSKLCDEAVLLYAAKPFSNFL